jgi:hypothetical protein
MFLLNGAVYRRSELVSPRTVDSELMPPTIWVIELFGHSNNRITDRRAK